MNKRKQTQLKLKPKKASGCGGNPIVFRTDPIAQSKDKQLVIPRSVRYDSYEGPPPNEESTYGFALEGAKPYLGLWIKLISLV